MRTHTRKCRQRYLPCCTGSMVTVTAPFSCQVVFGVTWVAPCRPCLPPETERWGFINPHLSRRKAAGRRMKRLSRPPLFWKWGRMETSKKRNDASVNSLNSAPPERAGSLWKTAGAGGRLSFWFCFYISEFTLFVIVSWSPCRALEERQKRWDMEEEQMRQKIIQQRKQRINNATQRFQRSHLPHPPPTPPPPPPQRYMQGKQCDMHEAQVNTEEKVFQPFY